MPLTPFFFYAEGVVFTKSRVARLCELPWVLKNLVLYPLGVSLKPSYPG